MILFHSWLMCSLDLVMELLINGDEKDDDHDHENDDDNGDCRIMMIALSW